MNTNRKIRSQKCENGIALLISIFVLLLICVVAIALIVASGTESALAGNYRSATAVYYAALAGLEEGRGRLLPKNPDYFLNTNANFVPHPGSPMLVSYASYIINPVGGETVAPWDVTNLATYPDIEYASEFGSSPPASSPQMSWTNSVSTVAGIQGPLYKWVRINAVTERTMKLDLNGDGTQDSTTPVYYDGQHLNLSASGAQVLEITSLAVLPNGTQKILQYLVAPNLISLPPFPAAITLLGNNVDYTGPNTSSWYVNGTDSISLGSCSPGPPVWAVGYFNNSDSSHGNIDTGTFTAHSANYTGQGGSMPNLGLITSSIPANLQKPSLLDALAQNITQNADFVKDPPPTQPAGTLATFHGSDLPSSMSPTNLMTVVVNGNLDLTSWHNTGYGLLLVTGNLIYDPDASWYGIVLLIGQGTMTGSHAGSGQFVGGLFLAKTRDSSNNLFPDPNLPNSNGTAGTYGSNIEFDPAMGGNGVYYSSCWIRAAQPAGAYSTLSFHEIAQP